MKLSIVFPLMNQHPLARLAMEFATRNLSEGSDAELIIIDNASDIPFAEQILPPERQIIIRHDQSIGVYPTFWDALKVATGDVIAYFHSDTIVTEKDWDKRVLGVFETHPKIGMIGFIGSNEIDGSGGRGLGTCSNFQGDEYKVQDGMGGVKTWRGSKAEVHGARLYGLLPASVVDGCAMVFRRSVLEAIPQREAFPPHHFYDRLLSSEVRERGWTMATLGVEFDHISGQTVAHEPKYELMAQAWCEAHGIAKTHNWDDAVYHEAERQWLREYRDEKHLVPCKV